MHKVLCIIPARGGSKGLVGKNIKPILGKPLIAHTIEHAKKSEVCDVIWVSTDDIEIQRVALKYGAYCPVLRSADLALDLTPTEPVLKEALLSAEEYFKTAFEIVVFLQCTDIFRKPEWIRNCVNVLKDKKDIESAFYAYETHKNFWYQNDSGDYQRVLPSMAVYGPRQTRKAIYREDTGLACATRRKLIIQERRIGERVEIFINKDFRSGIDIHTAFDFWLAEQILRYGPNHDES